MTNRIELARLPSPQIVESLDFEEIFAHRWEKFVELAPDYTAFVETDPSVINIQNACYQELLLRQRMNDVATGLLLAKAIGSDLDHIAASYYGVERLLINKGDDTVTPIVPSAYETDSELRFRAQLSLEGRTTAGPRGSYIFHGLSVDTTIDGGVKDIEAMTSHRVIDPNGEIFSAIQEKLSDSIANNQAVVLTPEESDLILDSWNGQGHVYVTVLAREGNGMPSLALLDKVKEKLNAEDIRPLTDFVHYSGPRNIYEYMVEAEIYFYEGPDPDIVKALALTSLQEYVFATHKLGHDVTISGLHRAIHQEGVQNVVLTSLQENIVVAHDEVAFCTGITLTSKGVNE